MKKVSFVYSEELDIGGYPDYCPFNTKRPGMAYKTAQRMGLIDEKYNSILKPIPLTNEELQWFHTSSYINALDEAGKGIRSSAFEEMGLGTAECPIFDDMLNFIKLSAGATMTGMNEILSGKSDIVFSPSGGYHHAEPSQASGFCFVNDIVLAAMKATKENKRVLILDFDVHHCDGIQNMFYARNDVMVISMHEDGKTLFPGTGDVNQIGTGAGTGYTINIPLPVGTYNHVYYSLFQKIVIPAIRSFKPDIIITELGMDALFRDPLAHLNLSNSVFVDMLQDLMELNIPLLATGGGGYNIENTVRSWVLCWSVLSDNYIDNSALSIGGVMHENTDWVEGLRDRPSIVDAGHRSRIAKEIDKLYVQLQSMVLQFHNR
jgi:acetoin utilization protein AcuC